MKHHRRSKLAENTAEGSAGKAASSGRRHVARADSGRMEFLAAGLIVLAAAAAYVNSFQGVFVFDDLSDISGNASLRHLWPIWRVFLVPSDGGMAPHGRPVVILSLALNYAMGGLNTFPYHLTNLLLHVLAGLTLFGIVRRTLLLPGLGERFAGAATPVALFAALIWTLHPLQTESVTYIVQRYESMMGLFYLLALYAAIRCGTSANPGRWAAAAAAAALLSMGCKEVAVSVPIIILLYDRAFLAGSFREALRRRRKMYRGLAAAWLLFAVFQSFSARRGAWVGYGLRVSWLDYARSQFGVLLHYLRLSFWPHPLLLDYAWPVARSVSEILPGAVVIGGLAAATGYALVRWPKWGFLGAWFFLILAPTSSIMPLADLAFEHRMYLPLAAVTTAAVLGGYLAGAWLIRRGTVSPARSRVIGGALVTCTCIALGGLTFQRNVEYQDALALWKDIVMKAPGNSRAHNNLGATLADRGRLDEALTCYRKALKIEPHYANAHNNLGVTLMKLGRFDEAVAECRKALEIDLNYADAHSNLGGALTELGRFDEATAECRKALELQPDHSHAHNNLGVAMADRGRLDEALTCYRKALKIEPDYANAHNNLGATLMKLGRFDEAASECRKALEIDLNYADAHSNLGAALTELGRFDEATTECRKALELRPDHTDARTNLGMALLQSGQVDEAIPVFREVLAIRPDSALAYYNLGLALMQKKQFQEAILPLRKAVALKADDAKAHNNLGVALTNCGQLDEAISEYEKALAIQPDYAKARDNLGIVVKQRAAQ
jgi:protein O-mannosyl-transferase